MKMMSLIPVTLFVLKSIAVKFKNEVSSDKFEQDTKVFSSDFELNRCLLLYWVEIFKPTNSI